MIIIINFWITYRYAFIYFVRLFCPSLPSFSYNVHTCIKCINTFTEFKFTVNYYDIFNNILWILNNYMEQWFSIYKLWKVKFFKFYLTKKLPKICQPQPFIHITGIVCSLYACSYDLWLNILLFLPTRFLIAAAATTEINIY